MNSSTGHVTTAFLDFAVCNQATAHNTFERIDEKMKLYDINWSKCVAFSSDNASVMIGKNNSIYTRIGDSNPDVYPVGCACHLAHLCAKKVANQLSVNVEQLVIDLYYHFDKSSKRKEIFQSYQVFCDVETRKILKHSSTRWLSLMKCIDRVLRQYDTLKSYFSSCLSEKKASDKNKKKSKIAILAEQLNDAITKVYMLFLHSVLPVFDSFTALLESEEPLIHKVRECIMKLVKELLGRFVNMQCIHEAKDSLLDIDYEDPTLQLRDRQLRIGFATRQFIQKEDLEGTSDVKKFYQEVRSFFIRALNYVTEMFPHDDVVVNNAIVLDVGNRSKATFENVYALLDRFPGIVEEDEVTTLENEFLEYQLLDDSELPDTSLVMADGTVENRRIDEVWSQIFEMKNFVTGLKRFPTLAKFITAILLIPHSNAHCERLFSMVRKNRTESRSSTAVGTLSALIATKINLFGNLKCYQFKPGKEVLRKAKTATCNLLNKNTN